MGRSLVVCKSNSFKVGENSLIFFENGKSEKIEQDKIDLYQPYTGVALRDLLVGDNGYHLLPTPSLVAQGPRFAEDINSEEAKAVFCNIENEKSAAVINNGSKKLHVYFNADLNFEIKNR